MAGRILHIPGCKYFPSFFLPYLLVFCVHTHCKEKKKNTCLCAKKILLLLFLCSMVSLLKLPHSSSFSFTCVYQFLTISNYHIHFKKFAGVMLLIEALYLFSALLPACLKNTENKCAVCKDVWLGVNSNPNQIGTHWHLWDLKESKLVLTL